MTGEAQRAEAVATGAGWFEWIDITFVKLSSLSLLS